MVSQNVRRSAMCIFLGVACALAAMLALVLLDVVRTGRGSSAKSSPQKEASARGPGAVNQTTAGVRKSTARHTAVRAKHGGHSTHKPHKTRGTPATVHKRRTIPEESSSTGGAEYATPVPEQAEPRREATDSDSAPGGDKGDRTADNRTNPTTHSQHEAHSSIDRRQITSGSLGEGANGSTVQPAEGDRTADNRTNPTTHSQHEAHSNIDRRQMTSGSLGEGANGSTVQLAEGDRTADNRTNPTTHSQHEAHSSIDRRQMTSGSLGEGANGSTVQPAEASMESAGKSAANRGQPSKSAGSEMPSDADERAATTKGGQPTSPAPMPRGEPEDNSTLPPAMAENESMGSSPGESVGRIGGVVTQNKTLSAMVEKPSSTKPGAAAALARTSNPPSASAHDGDKSDGNPQTRGRLGGDIGGPNRLLCTVGSRAMAEEMLPPDGLCDRLFYTDVIWRGMTIRGSQNQESWNSFQKAARNSTKTGYGFSVDYGQADRFFANMMTPMGERKLREVFQGKIVHYGILKATGRVAQLLEDMHGKLGVLRLLKQLQGQFTQKTSEARENLDLVLGIKFQSYKNRIDSNQHSSAMTALANHLPITIFIVHTHIQDWKDGKYPIIGTVWYYWSEITNTPNEPSLRRTARELKDAVIPVRTYVMPSFTMMVGEFQQKENATEKSSNSTYMLTKEFRQLCKSRTSVSIVNAGIVKLSAADYNRTYTYEDVDTMSAKARAFFNLYHHPHQGWAVFDTEYEDYDNTCGKGAFTRLTAFKATLNATLSQPADKNKR